ncbi:MAG: hypothetical protein ABI333_13765 [bacterium]
MGRPRHPHKDIESAIKDAEGRGWRVEHSKRGHVWGTAYCQAGQGGCIIRIASTPRNPTSAAKRLAREFEKCPHAEATEDV